MLPRNCSDCFLFFVLELAAFGYKSLFWHLLSHSNFFSPTGIDIATRHGLPVVNDRGYYFKQDPVVHVSYIILLILVVRRKCLKYKNYRTGIPNQLNTFLSINILNY